MSDLAQKIKDHMADYDHGDPVGGFVDAVEAVLKVHKHMLYDQWGRETSDSTAAVNGYCFSCHGQNGALVWCSTVRAVAAALGVSVDQPEKD